MIARFRSNAKNDFSYASQPSRLVHLPSSDPVPVLEGSKNVFHFALKQAVDENYMEVV